MKIVKKNIDFLLKAFEKESSLATKLEIIQLVVDNLEYLKAQMDDDEYTKQYSALEARMKRKIEKVTNPKIYEDLSSRMDLLLQKLEEAGFEKKGSQSTDKASR